MTITIRNQANIRPQYIRFVKWKIEKIGEKFNNLIYAEVRISKEGSSKPVYKVVLKLGIPGNDIIITNTSTDLAMLWKKSLDATERHLRKYKERSKERRIKMPRVRVAS